MAKRHIPLLIQVLLSIALLFGVVLVGCASISHSRSIKATDLSEVQLNASRATIERTLGEPIEVGKVNDLTVATYAYDRERPAQDVEAGGVIAEVLFLQWQPIIWAVEAGSREKEKSRLTITYGPDDTVVKLDPALVGARERFLRAACGNASSQYIAGYEQEHGLGVSQNLVNAYVWYSIAATAGRPEAALQRDQIAKKMKPEQLAEANRIVETWTPPQQCSQWRGGQHE